MPQKVTIYLDDDIYQEVLRLMANKIRTLSYIVNELTKQAIREKMRKKKVEKQSNPISDNPTNPR
jgi:Arc/MetJ family transcription regulator